MRADSPKQRGLAPRLQSVVTLVGKTKVAKIDYNRYLFAIFFTFCSSNKL